MLLSCLIIYSQQPMQQWTNVVHCSYLPIMFISFVIYPVLVHCTQHSLHPVFTMDSQHWTDERTAWRELIRPKVSNIKYDYVWLNFRPSA